MFKRSCAESVSEELSRSDLERETKMWNPQEIRTIVPLYEVLLNLLKA